MFLRLGFVSLACCIMQFSSLSGSEIEDLSAYKKQMETAICKNDLKTVSALLQQAPDQIEEFLDANYSNKTPLLYAAEKAQASIINYFINCGADIHACSKYGNTVLNAVIKNDLLSEQQVIEIVQHLAEAGIDINASGMDGYTAIMCACEGKRLSLIKLLVDLGADVKIRAKNGNTTLMVAAAADNVPAIELFRELGVNINAVNNLGFNAFTWAIKLGKKRSFDYFLNKLAVDVNQKDQYGATPIIWATFSSSQICWSV